MDEICRCDFLTRWALMLADSGRPRSWHRGSGHRCRGHRIPSHDRSRGRADTSPPLPTAGVGPRYHRTDRRRRDSGARAHRLAGTLRTRQPRRRAARARQRSRRRCRRIRRPTRKTGRRPGDRYRKPPQCRRSTRGRSHHIIDYTATTIADALDAPVDLAINLVVAPARTPPACSTSSRRVGPWCRAYPVGNFPNVPSGWCSSAWAATRPS